MIAAGPFLNLLIAFLILFGLAFGPTRSRRWPRPRPGSPAARVLKPGDRIISVDGVRGDQADLAQLETPVLRRPVRLPARTPAVLQVEETGRC